MRTMLANGHAWALMHNPCLREGKATPVTDNQIQSFCHWLSMSTWLANEWLYLLTEAHGQGRLSNKTTQVKTCLQLAYALNCTDFYELWAQ